LDTILPEGEKAREAEDEDGDEEKSAVFEHDFHGEEGLGVVVGRS
jgi:hypothetical protein